MERRFIAFGALCAVAVLVACAGWVQPEPNNAVVRISKDGHIAPRATTIIEQDEPELLEEEYQQEDEDMILDAEDTSIDSDASVGTGEDSVTTTIKQATTFFGCLVALVMATIGFDFVKESIIEYVEESQLAPVVDAMFGELTVLGFIGLVSFMLGKLKVFTWISEKVYSSEIAKATGEEKLELEKEVPEIFENLHMMLFMVMCIFILEVLLTIYYAKMIQSQWEQAEGVCHDPEKLAAVMDGWHPRDHTITEKATEAMQKAGLDPDDLDFMMDYLSLRVEFIDPRESERQHLGAEFDFADYMGHVMGIVLSGIVNVSVYEWLALLGVFTGFYIFFVVTSCHMTTLGIIMIVFVYTLALMVLALDRKLTWVMKQLTSRPKARNYLAKQLAIMEAAIAKNQQAHNRRATPRTPPADETTKDETAKPEGDESAIEVEEPAPEPEAAEEEAPAEVEAPAEKLASEETPLVVKDLAVVTLPAYLEQDPITQRGGCSKFFLGMLPNKHEQLFWFDRKGPQYNRMFIQVVLVLMAIYIPIEGGYIYAAASKLDIPIFIGYLVVTILPILFVFYETMQVLSLQLLVCNVEMMRRRELIQKCKMSQRTKKVVRILQIINRLRQKAEVMRAATEAASEDPESPEKEEIDPKRRLELEEIFDFFDADSNGTLDVEELSKFLTTLGQPGNIMDLANTLVNTLDKDGNGTVEKDEFVAWMIKSEQHSMEKEEISEIAAKMFALFDRDGDGYMTQDEFAVKMESFGIKLTDEELALLMRELDEDGTGRIEEDDFKVMLERHDFEAD